MKNIRFKPYIILVLFLCLIEASFAAAPSYDTNCVDLGKKKGWIKSYDQNASWKRSYNHSAIKKDFHVTQTNLKQQVKGWQTINSEVDCLQKIAGLNFENENLIITDMNKFKTFRLAGSDIQCNLDPSQVEYKSSEGLTKGYDNTKMPNDSPYNSVLANEGNLITNEMHQQMTPSSQYEDGQKLTSKKLQETLTNLKKMGDLGFENYCAHQLYLGSASDEFTNLKAALDHCHSARDKKDLKTLSSPACQGYPDAFKIKLDELSNTMNDINVDMNKPNSQPVVKLNEVDNKIYAEFKNDLQRLKEAQGKAEKDLKINATDYEYLRSVGLQKDAAELTACGGENVWTDQFVKGNSCQDQTSTITSLKVNLSYQVDTMKNLHRQKLLNEINLEAFGETVKAKYYMSPKLDQSQMLKNPKAACLELTKEPLACNGDFLKTFKKSVNSASTNSDAHFFALDIKTVAKEFNETLKQMEKVCQKIRTSQRPNILLDPDQDVIIPDHKRVWKCGPNCEEFTNEMSGLMKSLQSHPAAAYFFTDAVGEEVNMNAFTPENGCAGLPMGFSNVDAESLTNARRELLKAVDNQISTTVDIVKPDSGSLREDIGAWQCGVGIKEKKELYALNAFYKSHPYMMGKALKNVDQTEQGVYNALICDAIACDQSVQKSNENFYDGLKVASAALNLVPVWGTIAYGAVNAAINSVGAYRKWDNANEDLDLMKQGIATGGYDEYHKDIKDFMNDLETDGSTVTLISTVMTEVALAAIKGAGVLDKGPMNSINQKLFEGYSAKLGRPLTTFEKDLLSKMTETAFESFADKAKSGIQGNFEMKDTVPSLKECIIALAVVKSGTAQKIFKSPKGTDAVLDFVDLPSEAYSDLSDPDMENYISKHGFIHFAKDQ